MLELRQVAAAEFEEWVRVEARAYGNRLNADPEVLRPNFDLDRSIAVLDNGRVVGGAHSHLQEISIPGGTSPIAGVANIAVQPTHRRRPPRPIHQHHPPRRHRPGRRARRSHRQPVDVHPSGDALP